MKLHGETSGTHGADRLRCARFNMKFSTYNVRTLLQAGKFHQLCTGSREVHLDIIGIQEHRWTIKPEIEIDYKWDTDREYMMAYSSAGKRSKGGVGILINKKHIPALKSVDKITERIIQANFRGNPEVSVVSAYGPTEEAKQSEKDEFYADLEKCISSIPAHNLLIILGDFNARVGQDSHLTSPIVVGRHTFHDTTNDNGERLVALCEATSLRLAQQRFPHPPGRQWTWMHPNGNKAQLDHILIRSKWVNSLRNCRSYSSVEVDSDHCIPTANIKLSLKKNNQNKSKKIRYDWEKLRYDRHIQQSYAVEVKNQFAALHNDNTTTNLESTQDQYNKLLKCIETSNDIVLPKIKPQKACWVSTRSEEFKKKRDTAKIDFFRTQK